MEEHAKVVPFRAVMQTSEGDRFTRNFFSESIERARERAQHHAEYERHVLYGDNAGSVAVMVVAEITGAPDNRRFKENATKSTRGD